MRLSDFLPSRVVFACMAIALCLQSACGDSTPTGPTLLASPSPAPTPEPLQVIVRAEARFNGEPTTGVQAGQDFKVDGSASQCFQGGDSVKCPTIPLWQQSVVGGNSAGCEQFGGQNSNPQTWNCKEATPDGVSIQVCALSLDKVQLGCDIVHVFIG